jgi:subtilisin family serine protease
MIRATWLRALAPVLAAAAFAACDRPATGPLGAARAPGDLAPVHSAGAAAIPGRYVVVLESGVASPASESREMVAAHGGSLHYSYEAALKGFAATLSPEAVEQLRRNPQVRYVAEDGWATLDETQQNNATWGLDRIDQRALPLSTTFSYTATGAGVNVYVIDTGIRTTHAEFGARASVGADFVGDGYNGQDCRGHGTHVAGTVAGTTYGVAKGANVISVRVFGCSGGAAFSTILAAVDWVTANAQKPAVANMSLGGGVYAPMNDAVTASIASGVVYAVSAGNDNLDACTKSPASAPAAITVASSTSADARSSFSNWGSCVDLFAPGSSITSAWYTSNTAAAILSGTSMAAPHVAGVAAAYLQGNPTATPATVAQALLGAGTTGVITDVVGSPNILLYSPAAVLVPPTAPASLTATVVAPAAMGLTWVDRSGNEASFTLARRVMTGPTTWSTWETVAAPAANATAIADSTLTAGSTYQYRIRACNAAGCSSYSPSPWVTLSAPTVPTGASATPLPGNRIQVTWTDASTTETSFTIARRVVNPDRSLGPVQPLGSVPANATAYADSTVTAGQTYRYQVRACNGAGCSAVAATPNVTAPAIPASPTHVAALATSATGVQVTWTDASSDETSFTVARRMMNPDSTMGTAQTLARLGAGAVSYADATATGGRTYRYFIRSCNLAGCSIPGASAHVTTPSP